MLRTSSILTLLSSVCFLNIFYKFLVESQDDKLVDLIKKKQEQIEIRRQKRKERKLAKKLAKLKDSQNTDKENINQGASNKKKVSEMFQIESIAFFCLLCSQTISIKLLQTSKTKVSPLVSLQDSQKQTDQKLVDSGANSRNKVVIQDISQIVTKMSDKKTGGKQNKKEEGSKAESLNTSKVAAAEKKVRIKNYYLSEFLN